MVEKYVRNPNTRCAACRTSIYRRPIEIRSGRVFCSLACRGKADRKEHPCLVCNIPILASANKKTCSRECANTRRNGIQYKTGRPKKDNVQNQRALKLRLMEARGRHCERCSFPKTEILHVHHKDRNRKHNGLQNLELICPNCHAEEHYLENSWMKGILAT